LNTLWLLAVVAVEQLLPAVVAAAVQKLLVVLLLPQVVRLP
jgi:hypothetical protein